MPLKIAVIGVGHMGRIHLGKLMAMENVQVVGIADIDRELAEDVSKKYQVPFFTDYLQMLNGLNGVVIASPTETHYEIAKTFLENDVHVFIEKPITTSIEEADDLIKLAGKKKVTK